MNRESLYNIEKMNNSNSLVLIKYGNFYKTFGNDAILLWNLFDYRIIEGRVSFPISVMGSNVSKLVRMGINVIIINNVTDIKKYDSLTGNNYEKYVNESLDKYDTFIKNEEINKMVVDRVNKDINNYEKIKEFLKTL